MRSGVAALALSLVMGGSIGAQEIVGDPFWGFDGTIVPNRFNLLTVHVRNNTNKPINKHLQLIKNIGGLEKGAPMVKSCYLGPGTQRFLQFHPFVVSTGDAWQLSWVEGGAAGKSVGQPIATMPSTVILEEEPITTAKRLRLESFSPRQLPASASAMGTLRALVIDQDPELSKPQREALLDWLRRGGEVHLLLRGTEHPVLTDELEVLNSDEYVIEYGSGRVFRHTFDRSALRENVPEALYGGAELTTSGFRRGDPLSSLLRKTLRKEVRPEFGWGLIFTLAVVYLILVGPILYRLSLNRLSWPFSLAALAGIVAVATWVFTVVGARGNNEIARVHSWSYARLAGDAMYEVTRFANVFVTTGGDYEFGDGGSGLFSSGQVRERINGRIKNGPNAKYTVDMPRFSDRFVVHKNTVAGPKAGIKFDGEKISIDLDLGKVVSVNGTRMYTWKPAGGGMWVHQSVAPLISVLAAHDINRNTLVDTVIARMNLRNLNFRKGVTWDQQHVFFCMGPTPEEFRLKGRGPGVDLGREESDSKTVYRFDLLLRKK